MSVLFELIVMVDWSADASVGPEHPSADKCWVGWCAASDWRGDSADVQVRYCRTRSDARRLVTGLLADGAGSALVGFDFPLGYPRGSTMGGGRALAALLASHQGLSDLDTNQNQRFEIAAGLNQRIASNLGLGTGPFWGAPSDAGRRPPPRRPAVLTQGLVPEYRIVEQRLRQHGRTPSSCWQLFYPGSVGGQALTGLPVVHRILTDPHLRGRARIWPFETGWDADLSGIVCAEVWPTLVPFDDEADAIRDARQVRALCRWALGQDAAGTLRARFARPRDLGEDDARTCVREEGWILGV